MVTAEKPDRTFIMHVNDAYTAELMGEYLGYMQRITGKDKYNPEAAKRAIAQIEHEAQQGISIDRTFVMHVNDTCTEAMAKKYQSYMQRLKDKPAVEKIKR